jgi:hypothetical protein
LNGVADIRCLLIAKLGCGLFDNECGADASFEVAFNAKLKTFNPLSAGRIYVKFIQVLMNIKQGLSVIFRSLSVTR